MAVRSKPLHPSVGNNRNNHAGAVVGPAEMVSCCRWEVEVHRSNTVRKCQIIKPLRIGRFPGSVKRSLAVNPGENQESCKAPRLVRFSAP